VQSRMESRQAGPGPRTPGTSSGSQPSPDSVAIVVVARGNVAEDERNYAVDRIRLLIDKINEPVLLARIRLGLAPDPARKRPAEAQALVDVNGDLVRAQIAAETLLVAADLLIRRLHDKLQHRAQHRLATRTRSGTSEPGEWRHGNLPAPRPTYYPRPLAERQLVRRKTFAVDEQTPEEATFDMGQLDYDFYLFQDLASGQDAAIQREEDGSYRVSCLDPTQIDLGGAGPGFAVSPHPAPILPVEEAVKRLEAIGSRFLFFIDSISHRGNIVYHRYDGHYGLITSG
jgi:Sigma 54 modulation/S30EA ribosomal protein C terminus